MILTSLTLAIGGALGAVTRYQTTRFITRIHPSENFPTPTLLINITGSALLGTLMGLLHNTPAELSQSPIYLLLGVGFCGAFTTFSTFSVETHRLLHNTPAQKKRAAAAYVILTITGCLALFIACYSLAATLNPQPVP